METRASYIAVGTFIILLALGAAGFTIWLGNLQFDRAVDRYVINFSGSVSGLQQGSTVRYQGVPVGRVDDIRISPDDPSVIQTIVQVDSGLPIRADSYAQLQLAGITGQQYVEITGGSADAGPLPQPDEGLPEIPSRPSTFAAITEELPAIIAEVNEALERLNQALSDDNIASLTGTLDNIEAVSASAQGLLSDTREEIRALIVNADGLVEETRIDMARLSDGAANFLTAATGEVEAAGDEIATAGDQIEQAVAEVGQAADAFSNLADQTSVLVTQTRPGLVDFSQYGLFEFTLLVEELRALSRSFNRILEQIERDPTQFFFGDTSSGIRVE